MPESNQDGARSKKIQRYIPGFIGYGDSKNLVNADRFLRFQISQKIGLARRELSDARAALIGTEPLVVQESMDSLLSLLKRLDGEISYGERGYPASINVPGMSENKYDQLYEYDAILLDHIGAMLRLVFDIKSSALTGDTTAMKKQMGDFQAQLGVIEDTFIKRMHLIGL